MKAKMQIKELGTGLIKAVMTWIVFGSATGTPSRFCNLSRMQIIKVRI